jgi:hypothetical protein
MWKALSDPRQAWVSMGALALGAAIVLVGVPRLDSSPAEVASCRAEGGLVRVPDLSEASGLAASVRAPGRFWSHNDSGEPVLFALDTGGRLAGRVTLSGVTVEDWEAIAVADCPAGTCLYVADIGDNDAKRDRVTIYRATEPDAPGATLEAAAIHAKYPDGAHDAETLLAGPDGQLHIVTKGETGPATLYRFPAALKADATVTLERVGQPRATNAESDRITDGAVSADGGTVVLRTKQTLISYRATDFFGGTWREARRQSLEAIAEPQGEGLAFGAGGVLFVAGEGGGKSAPGTFARLVCSVP